jgi:hypothetical protein
MPKKVLVDLTYIIENSCAGVVVYAFRLLKELNKYKDYKFVLLVTKENAKYICSQCNGYEVIKIDNNLPLSSRLYWFNSFFLRRKINQIIDSIGISLIFSPYVNIAGIYTRRIPQIGVIHDMQPFYQFSFVKKNLLKYTLTPKIKRLNRIITISNASKGDILQICGNQLSDRIEVVYNSVKYINDRESEDINVAKRPYILYVNTLEEYKNILTLLKAFNRIKDKIPHKLVIKAKKTLYYNEVIEGEIKKMELQKRIILIQDFYSDEDMATLYANASLFVSPSTMEGFGYTPIEAAMHLVPVICTRIPALYESTLGMLHYYDNPYNDMELGNKMLDVLANKDNRDYSDIAEIFKRKYSLRTQVNSVVKIMDSII